MKAVCFFSGAGGGSIGLENAGLDVALAVDNDRFGNRTHRRFCPGIPIDDADLSEVHPADVLIRNGTRPDRFSGLALITAPCQAFSSCGKQDLTDPRRNLLMVAPALAESCPKAFIVVENVPGLLERPVRRALLALIEGLRAAGREVSDDVGELKGSIINAADFGIPQNRRRFILIVPPEGREPIDHPKPTVRRYVTVGEAIGPRSGFRDPDPRFRQLRKAEAVIYGCPDNQWSARYRDNLLRKHGKSHKPFQRIEWDRPSNTIIAQVGNTSRVAMIHPDIPRFLTIGEMMRLQGFPLDRGPILGPVEAAIKQVGNALPPALAAAVGRAVLKASGKRKSGSGTPGQRVREPAGKA